MWVSAVERGRKLDELAPPAPTVIAPCPEAGTWSTVIVSAVSSSSTSVGALSPSALALESSSTLIEPLSATGGSFCPLIVIATEPWSVALSASVTV